MWRGYSLTWYHPGAEDWFQILFFKGKVQEGEKPMLLRKKG